MTVQIKMSQATRYNRRFKDGLLSVERLESYWKLKREAKYEGLNAKMIEKEKINDMFSSMGGIKNAKKSIKKINDKNGDNGSLLSCYPFYVFTIIYNCLKHFYFHCLLDREQFNISIRDFSCEHCLYGFLHK